MSTTDRVYLDTATKGVPPAPAVAALGRAVEAWAAGTADHGEWEAAAEDARRSVAAMLGVGTYDVALLPSQVAGASTIARRMPDAAVVVPEEEYRSNLLPWQVDRDRVRLVPTPATTEAVCAAVDDGTDLVALSSVQSATGLRVDLPVVVEHAHRHGALVYVDASQSLGVDATLAHCGADFVGAVAYKWLRGARGAAFLMVRPEHQRRLAPVFAGPESAADGSSYGAEHRPWDDARRFDQPLAWLSWVATAAALRTAADPGEAETHATGLAAAFRAGLRDAGYEHGPLDRESPIVLVPHAAATTVAEELTAAGIRIAVRPGGLRFAFHHYNSEDHVERSLAVLRAVRSNA